MNKTNYIVPSRDLFLNVGLTLKILDKLYETKRGLQILNIERLTLYLFLIKKPLYLNELLSINSKRNIDLKNREIMDINSEEIDVSPVFETGKVRVLLGILTSMEYLDVRYHKKHGFVFLLTKKGEIATMELKLDYFERIEHYLSCISQIQSTPISKLQQQLIIINGKYE